jgi:hypothetical protein
MTFPTSISDQAIDGLHGGHHQVGHLFGVRILARGRETAPNPTRKAPVKHLVDERSKAVLSIPGIEAAVENPLESGDGISVSPL